MTQVSVEEASARLAQLVRDAEAGEPVVIVHGDRAVQLVPLPAATSALSRPRFGSAAGKVRMADDFDAPLEDFAEYT